jgi:hypothetical protein
MGRADIEPDVGSVDVHSRIRSKRDHFVNRACFKGIDKKARFRRDGLLYSGVIIEKCVCLARFSYSELQSANKSASLPRNFEAGSNVIDASEPQKEKQDSPMTVTEAGR